MQLLNLKINRIIIHQVYQRDSTADRDYFYLGSQLIAHQGAGARTFIHPDLLGTTAAKSNAAGAVIKRMRYAPFGLPWGQTSGQSGENEITYTGHKHDTDIGLTYMQARYYDPVIGRFYSNDPVGYSSENPVMSFNRYLYVNNNPYKYTDPDGEFLNFVFQAAVGAAIEAGIQIATEGKVTNWTKVGVSAAAGAAGVGLAKKGADLVKVMSAGKSKVTQTATQLAVDTTNGVAANAIETSTNNIINSVTGNNEVANINVGGAAGNAATNTLTGNAVDNKLGNSNSKTGKVMKAGTEAARKLAEAFLE